MKNSKSKSNLKSESNPTSDKANTNATANSKKQPNLTYHSFFSKEFWIDFVKDWKAWGSFLFCCNSFRLNIISLGLVLLYIEGLTIAGLGSCNQLSHGQEKSNISF